MQLRLPVVVVGGGLTAIDTATEALAYYPLQVEKFLSRYDVLAAELGDLKRFETAPKLMLMPRIATRGCAAFMPRHPSVYGNLLKKRIAEGRVDCWLVNTGWTGGKYGTGRRMPIKATRALLTAALDGSLRNADFRTDKYFGFAVPTALPGVPSEILDPVNTWKDKAEFDKTARALVGMFQKNFAKFEAQVDAEVLAAAPDLKLAAE